MGKGRAVGTFSDEQIEIDGVSREYRLAVPQSADRTQPVPILLGFDGCLIDSTDGMPKYS